MPIGVIGCGSRFCSSCPYPFGSDLCEEQNGEIIEGDLDEKIGGITLDPDTPENRKFWAGKIGMFADPDLFYLVRKRRAEAIECKE
jgi:hypothetical protein